VAVIPLLALLGLSNILDNKNFDVKKILIPGGALALFCVLLGFVGPGIFDMTAERDASYANQFRIDPSILVDDRVTMMRSSCLRSALFMILSLAALWAFHKSILKRSWVMIIIGILAFVDIVGINLKYLSPADYVKTRSFDNNFALREVDKQILKDSDPHYRVYDRTVSIVNDASISYHHKTIGGYHPAKLQRYQDIIDLHISRGNQDVLNMLNTKYVIYKTSQEGPTQMQINTAALGNAWFVNSARVVNSANEEIEALNNFDPLGEAIVHQEFEDYVAGSDGQKNGAIQLMSYSPKKLSYNSNSTTDQLAVFSEVWYGPDKGWNAYIDGKKVEHIRANYILRALKIPAGSHDIDFVFEPSMVKIGRTISLICSALILLLFFYYLWTVYKGLDKTIDASTSDLVDDTELEKAKEVVKKKKMKKAKTTKKKKK